MIDQAEARQAIIDDAEDWRVRLEALEHETGTTREVMEELARNNRLEFRDFGVFETRTRAARTAQNPKTMEKVPVPPKRTVKFKMGRLMKQKLELPSVSEETAAE